MRSPQSSLELVPGQISNVLQLLIGSIIVTFLRERLKDLYNTWSSGKSHSYI